MRCLFCQTELGEPYRQAIPNANVLTCYACPKTVEYYFDQVAKDGEWIPRMFEYKLYARIKDTQYELAFRPDDQFPRFYLYKVEGNLRFPIFWLKQIPDLTPSNVRDKLPTYILFS